MPPVFRNERRPNRLFFEDIYLAPFYLTLNQDHGMTWRLYSDLPFRLMLGRSPGPQRNSTWFPVPTSEGRSPSPCIPAQAGVGTIISIPGDRLIINQIPLRNPNLIQASGIARYCGG